MDSKGRILGKLSIVDLLVIILVVGVLAGTLYKMRGPVAEVNNPQQSIHYTIRISDVRSFTTDFYKEGMPVYDTKTGNDMGEIVGITVTPYMAPFEKVDGTVLLVEKPGRVEILVELKADGVETDQSYMVGGTYDVKAGAGAYLSTKYVETSGAIESVWAKDIF